MSNPIFILKEGLSGAYLLGSYAWNEAMRIDSASLICAPPLTHELVLTLEVAGALTDKSFTLGPSALEVRQSLPLGVKLTSGQTVRWVATSFAGDIEDAPSSVTITLAVTREVDAVVPDQVLTVWWRSGHERFRLFTYDPVTHVFTAATPLALGRATITDLAGVFTIALQSVPALRVSSNTLYTNTLVAGGSELADQPQLQFYVGPTPIATLTQTGALFVPVAQQLAPVDQVNQFLLGLGAALNASGVVASTFEQPL